ncbi:hypothetical protein [uncultured Roseobacter sp.]|uniref:hypothetical protein n=1 Tax=uncultured Roseobacter sp. TaxID=114847 RepID=UPI00260690B8|nr:hypothetical protein [uncultured Roseobacter sp.]
MRISIKHQTIRKGLLFKTTYYEVALTVLFTHEEIQIIRQCKLMKTKLFDRRPATAKVDDRDSKFELTVGDLINGKTDRFLCATPSAAKRYEEALLDTLQQLKLWIGDNADEADDFAVEL